MLCPATRRGAIPPLLEQGVAVAIAEGSGAHVFNLRFLHVAGVPLPHTKREVHVTVLLFLTCGARRFWEGQVADLLLLLLTETVQGVCAINDGADLQVKLEVCTALEPRATRKVLEARFIIITTNDVVVAAAVIAALLCESLLLLFNHDIVLLCTILRREHNE